MAGLTIINGVPPIFPDYSYVSIDTEWRKQEKKRLHRSHGEFSLLTVCAEPGTVYYIDTPALIQPTLDRLNNTVWLMHHAKFDITQLRKYATIPPRRKLIDTMLMEKLLWSGWYEHFDLQSLVRRYLNEYLDKSLQEMWETAEVVTPEMIEYACKDADATRRVWNEQKKFVTQDEMRVWHTIDLPALWAVMDFQGFRVDRDRWIELSVRHRQLSDEIDEGLPVNPRSPKQVVAYLREHGFKGLKSSAEADIITAINKFPKSESAKIATAILDSRGYRKLSSTYGANVIEDYAEETGEGVLLFGDFNIYGAATGRMSCVIGSTLLNTSRGTFRIDEYIPQEGDLILTHKKRWMPIIRKLFKGYEPIFLVKSNNGNVVQCTREHRLLTPDGWKSVGSLQIGQEIISYVGVKEIHQKPRKHKNGFASLFGGRKKTRNRGNSERDRNYLSECSLDSSDSDRWSAEGFGTRSENVSIKDGKEEPYVGQEWYATSQFQRTHIRRSRIFNEKDGRSLRFRASNSNGICPWYTRITKFFGRTSYRWKQIQQRIRQSSFSNQFRTQKITYENTRISEITPMGTMGVWDIEVAGDHSYLACGYINHNCNSPNLQNIPVREHPEFRECFIARNGQKLIICDYSQQEIFIMAYLSQDKNMMEICNSGRDIYIAMAKMIYGTVIEKSDPLRKVMKSIVLGTDYGMSKYGLAKRIGCSTTEAEEKINDFFNTFPGVHSWMKKQEKLSSFTTTVVGRKCWLNPYSDKSIRNSYNNPIQGTAAEMMKAAFGSLHVTWPKVSSYRYPVCAVVHDEMILDVPNDIADESASFVRSTMEAVANRMLPGMNCRADVIISDNWRKE